MEKNTKKKKKNVNVCTPESLRCVAEINTTLWVNNTSMLKKCRMILIELGTISQAKL